LGVAKLHLQTFLLPGHLTFSRQQQKIENEFFLFSTIPRNVSNNTSNDNNSNNVGVFVLLIEDY
jgi:hypothetical protein